MWVCGCVGVCVCVCVCKCVFILFYLLVSSCCTTSVTYVRGSDQRSFTVSITIEIDYNQNNMVNLLFSWGFIEILRYKQTARIKPLTENCACTFDTAHHGSDQSKPHSIGFLKEKFGVHTLSLPSISMVLLGTSATFLHLHSLIYHISPAKT